MPQETPDSRQIMTLAALNSLFVIWDQLYRKDPGNPPLANAIDGGLTWLGRSFKADANVGGGSDHCQTLG